MEITCKNCFSTLPASAKFCASCGQKTSVHRLSMHEIGHDVVHYFSHTDAGIVYVFKELITAPGKLALSYINGARKKVINPVTLLLICGTIMYFFMNVLHFDETATQAMQTPETKQFKSAQEKVIYTRLYNNGKKANEFNTKYSKILLLLMAPVFAFFFWLFYKKAKFNYAEHLVAYMFFSSITTLFSSFVFMPLLGVLKGTAGTFLLVGTVSVQCLYLGWCYYQLLGYSTTKQMVKSILYAIIVSTIMYLITGLLSAVYILLA